MEGSSKKQKRTHCHRQQCNDVGGRVVEVEEGVRGANGNGKNTIKIRYIYLY